MSVLLGVEGATKAYGGTQALRAGDLEVEEGTIHGIVGPNGAGKSTLMKIIAGHVTRDAGVIRLRGEEVVLGSPPVAQRAGIFAVPQEIALAPKLSVAENISLGAEPRWGPFVRRGRVRTTADAALAELELELDSSVPAGALRADQQRLVMFAQALSRKAALMIADEPTAGLSSQEAELVVSGLERLKRQGRTLLFVSHRFGEVLRLCDRVTIIRDGATVQTLERSALTREHLIRAVVGEESAAGRDRAAATPDRPVSLRVRDLRGRELRGVTFDAREGEILGVTGLAGSGVEELLAVVGGAETATDGAVALHGDACRFRSPADAIAGGVSYLPADRTRAGLLGMPVRTNVSLARTRATTSSGVLTRASERRATRPVLGRLGLESHADRPLSALSGGNRQRALIARSIFARAGVLLFADPTVGVDFRARAEIHDLLRELADEGRTVVISSSEPEELVALADRVIVLRQGVVKATLEGDGISPESMTAAATY